MGRFQLELLYLYFPPSSHLKVVCFCPVGLSLLIQHFSSGLVGVEVTSVIVIITKGLQDRNMQLLDGTTVENKGKLILTEIFPSEQKHDI